METTKDMLKEVLRIYGGPLEELLIHLSGDDGDEVFTELKRFNRKEPCWVEKPRVSDPSILRCISGKKNLTLDALSGARHIYNNLKTFESISSNFIDRGLYKPGIATPRTPIRIDRLIGKGKFLDIFSALPGAWEEKWLSQDQIIEFCEKLTGWLGNETATTLFLAKIDEHKPINEESLQDNLYVVYVRRLNIDADRIMRNDIWSGQDCLRAVSPKLPERSYFIL